MYMLDEKRKSLTFKDFFEDGGYKKYVYILAGDKAKKGDRPTDIWALLDNTSVNNNQDTWLIPESKVSTKNIYDVTYQEYYTSIINDSRWEHYTTSK